MLVFKVNKNNTQNYKDATLVFLMPVANNFMCNQTNFQPDINNLLMSILIR